MERMDPKDEKRNQIFQNMQAVIKDEAGDINEIEINISTIDELYSISLINKEVYEKEMATHRYPHFVHKLRNCDQD